MINGFELNGAELNGAGTEPVDVRESAVITGDVTQVDLPRNIKSGLKDSITFS